MNEFSFERPSNIQDAINNISTSGTIFIAGGTNLIDLMKAKVTGPKKLIDINKLDLRNISFSEKSMEVGALVTNSDLATHTEVKKQFPLISRAILSGATAQLRNMATTGGNLLQRTRCYYFYDVSAPCNKREPGSGCGAINGRNRNHAILGHSDHCIATHPSDMCVALAALDAVVLVTSTRGSRSIPILEFHRLPEDRPELDNNLAKDEIITSVSVPKNNFSNHSTYLKIRDRSSFSFAIISVAVAMELQGTNIKKAQIALGGVAHKPWRNKNLEDSLIGKPATEETWKLFAGNMLKDARGFKDNSFKIELAKRAIVKAMREAAQGTSHE